MQMPAYIKTIGRWLFVLFAGCVALLILYPKFQSPTIENALQTLSQEDRTALEWFFESNIDSFPYVLFGNKPMGITAFVEVPSFPEFLEAYDVTDWVDFFFNSINSRNLKLKRGWNLCKQYEYLFPSSNYIFIENRWNNWVTIILINKKAFLCTVEKNIEIFQGVLGQHITPQKVLESCLNCKDLFTDALHNHDGLFGILLGYGTHNAELFHRRFEIKRNPQRSQFSLTKKPLKPSEGFSTIEEEYNTICQKLTSFDNYVIYDFNPLLLVLPGFVADHSHPETQKLRKEYLKQYKTIVHEYQKGDFLEVTFKQFSDKKPLLKHLLTQRSQP